MNMWDELEKADNALRTVDKKYWTILSFKNRHDNSIHKIWQYQPTLMYGILAAYETLQWYLDYPNFNREDGFQRDFKIHSIKRESDGEIFTVGDELNNGVITCFEVNPYMKDSILIQIDNHIYTALEYCVNKLPAKKASLKGKDSYLVVGGHIPCAIYDEDTNDSRPMGGWWFFNEKSQRYVYFIHSPNDFKDKDDLKFFEKSQFRPFYNDKQVESFRKII